MRRSETISNVLIAVLIAIIGYFAYTMRDLILLACGAALCALASQPIIDRLRNVEFASRRPSVPGLVTMALLGIAELALVVSTLAPASAGWLHRTAATWQSTYGSALVAWIGAIPAAPARTVRDSVMRATAVVVVWLMLAIVMRQYGRRMILRAAAIAPPRLRPRMFSAFERIIDNHDEWLMREITLMLTAGVSSFMVLGLLGIKYFHFLAALTGAASLFPPVGLTAAMVVCGLAAGAESMFKLVGALAFFAAYSELESGFLRPRLADGRVALPLLALIVALMLGMTVAGLAGAMIALPTAAAASIVVGGYVIRSPRTALPLDPCAACELRELGVARASSLPAVAAEPVGNDAFGDSRGSEWPGRAALMLANAVAAMMVLALLEIEHPYALAAMVGAAGLIPIVGPLSALLVCAVVAGAESIFKVAAVLAFFALYPQVEAQWLEPRVADRVYAAAVAIVCGAVIAGFAGWGVAGAIGAIPVGILAAIALLGDRPRSQISRIAEDASRLHLRDS